MNLKKAFQYQSTIASIQYELTDSAMEAEIFAVVEENHNRHLRHYDIRQFVYHS